MSSLGSPTEVRSILGRSSAELTDPEINPFLQRAENFLKSHFHNSWNRDFFYTGVIRKTGIVNKTYKTYFPMSLNEDFAVAVYVSGSLITLTDDYTVDRASSTITFTSDFDLFAREKVIIEYTPFIAEDYVNYSASLMMLERGALNVADGTTGFNSREETRTRIKQMEQMFATKPNIRGWLDSNTYGAI